MIITFKSKKYIKKNVAFVYFIFLSFQYPLHSKMMLIPSKAKKY